MIFVILIFYVLPILLLTDLLTTAYKLAKGEGNEYIIASNGYKGGISLIQINK